MRTNAVGTGTRPVERGSDRRSRREADAVVKAIEGYGRRARMVQLDVGNMGAIAAFASALPQMLSDAFGRNTFDFLINNAGTGAHAPFVETTEAQFDELMMQHLKAPFFLTQKVLPHMVNGGRILNVSSGLARFTYPGASAYASMKGGVEVLMRYMARELGERKITANVVARRYRHGLRGRGGCATTPRSMPRSPGRFRSAASVCPTMSVPPYRRCFPMIAAGSTARASRSPAGKTSSIVESSRAMFADSSVKQYPSHQEIAAEALPANSSLTMMVEMTGAGKRVLDVGCASGYLAEALNARGCVVTGIDVNPTALEIARKHCAETFAADLDVTPLSRVLGERRFDVIVFGDVLEHVRNPLEILESARAHLGGSGYIVVSIPNVGHGAVRLALLSGRFEYQELGLLDETHLRFFTRKTIDELLLYAGFSIDETRQTILPLFEASDLVPVVRRDEFSAETIEAVVSDPDHETLQFVVRASPISDAARVRAVGRRFAAANDALADALSRVARLERELDALAREKRALEERFEQRDNERKLHLTARDRADAVIAQAARSIAEMQRRLDALTAEAAQTQALGEQLAALQRHLDRQRDAYATLEEQACAFALEVEERAKSDADALAAQIAGVHAGLSWRVRDALRRVLGRR